jgi:hypothetical protein
MTMRILTLTCVLFAAQAAMAEVPVPAPNPFGTREPVVDTACPEGSVPSAVAMSLVEQHIAGSGEAGAVVAGKLASSMRAALSAVTGKPVPPVSSIVVLSVPNADGSSGQIWVLFAGLCSPNMAVLPPHVVAAVWKQVHSTI